jgi:hypothetical protein
MGDGIPMMRRMAWPAQSQPRHQRQRLRGTVRRPIWGNLRRLDSFRASCGFGRGTVIDRYYMRNFFTGRAGAIRGVPGEVCKPTYCGKSGDDRVERIEIVDLDPACRCAALVADLSQNAGLPTDTFDCLVVMQTLQCIPQLERTLAVYVEALRPGGNLPVAVSALAAHDTNGRRRPITGGSGRPVCSPWLDGSLHRPTTPPPLRQPRDHDRLPLRLQGGGAASERSAVPRRRLRALRHDWAAPMDRSGRLQDSRCVD